VQKVRQLRNVRRDPSRLILGEQLGGEFCLPTASALSISIKSSDFGSHRFMNNAGRSRPLAVHAPCALSSVGNVMLITKIQFGDALGGRATSTAHHGTATYSQVKAT
jgi:hypothetical protein